MIALCRLILGVKSGSIPEPVVISPGRLIFWGKDRECAGTCCDRALQTCFSIMFGDKLSMPTEVRGETCVSPLLFINSTPIMLSDPVRILCLSICMCVLYVLSLISTPNPVYASAWITGNRGTVFRKSPKDEHRSHK